MAYKVQLREYTTLVGLPFMEWVVALAYSPLVVAKGFFSKKDAEKWIKEYNKKWSNPEGELKIVR